MNFKISQTSYKAPLKNHTRVFLQWEDKKKSYNSLATSRGYNQGII